MQRVKTNWTEKVRTLVARCFSFLHRQKLDSVLDEELRSHIELAIDENLRLGMTPQEARRKALRDFGGMEQTRENYRLRRGLPMLDQLLRDVRFGARQLMRAPGFTLTAVGTLALGLGANMAVFSLVNGLLLRPLPVPHAEELTVIYEHRSGDMRFSYSLPEPTFRAVARHREAFDSIAASSDTTMEVRTKTGTVQVMGTFVTGEYFTMLQTAPLLGRTLTVQDDQAGSPGVYAVVITEGFWHSWFQGTPDVIGKTLTIANQSFTIVGVMPKSFIGTSPVQRPQIFANIQAEPVIDAPYSSLKSGESSYWLNILGRRRKGVTLESANAALAGASTAVLEESTKDAETLTDAREHHFTLAAESGSAGFTYLRLLFRKPLVLVMSMCGGVLLLSCLNLASLLLARSEARQRELATRLALGASRRRLIQQLLIESLMIAGLGTVIGFALSPLVSHALAALLIRQQVGVFVDTAPDIRGFGFAALLTIVATLLIGLLPALRATGSSLAERMKLGGQTKPGQGFGRDRNRMLPRLLMSGEVALALLLVTGAGLLAASLTRLYRTGLGFEPKGVLNVELVMSKQSLKGDALVRWYQQYATALMHLPGVQSVSYASVLPLSSSMEGNDFSSPYSQGSPQMDTTTIGPGYFATMHTALLAGREFRWEDTSASGDKIILNEAAARMLFPGRNALGQVVKSYKHFYEVVGIVADAHYLSIQEQPPATAYRALTQATKGQESYTALVRVQGALTSVAEAARKLAVQMAPDAPAPDMNTMSSLVDDSISSERMMAVLSSFFGVFALLVTAIGLYGTLSYSTTRRTSEIGVRMALGARRAQVALMIFRENGWMVLSGSIVGLGIAMLAAKAIASFLYGTPARDPWVLAGAVAALVLVASAASMLPALRAARMQPMEALRTE